MKVHGIDVSHYQAAINWDTIAVQEIDFVFMKATEGLELVDKRFAYNWHTTKKVRLKRGAYHFFHPTLSAIWQAKNFINTVDLEYGDLPSFIPIKNYIKNILWVISTSILFGWLDTIP